MPESQSSILERTNTTVRHPRQYKVIMHNDDFTTMEFVVEILMSIFHKSEADANTLMLAIHHSGKAVAGVYSRDIAETKARKAMDLADAEGFPLRVTVEPE